MKVEYLEYLIIHGKQSVTRMLALVYLRNKDKLATSKLEQIKEIIENI